MSLFALNIFNRFCVSILENDKKNELDQFNSACYFYRVQSYSLVKCLPEVLFHQKVQ